MSSPLEGGNVGNGVLPDFEAVCVRRCVYGHFGSPVESSRCMDVLEVQ